MPIDIEDLLKRAMFALAKQNNGKIFLLYEDLVSANSIVIHPVNNGVEFLTPDMIPEGGIVKHQHCREPNCETCKEYEDAGIDGLS